MHRDEPPHRQDQVPDVIEDETDDDASLLDHDLAVIAGKGRGLIDNVVQAGSTPLIALQVPSGTTHLLLSTSATPNAMPRFLTSVLPQISRSLLALDISANFLTALPPVLAICEFLQELNVASNPLRALPPFLAQLTDLRILIADSTAITTLPDALIDLDRLHTISIRRNKFHALPSWLCLLPALQTLCIDGNPFQAPWRALVEPLLDTRALASASPDEEDNVISPEHAPFLVRGKPLPRQEEERYMRALRSVMEYLRDMNDLGSVSQQKNATSMVNGSEDVVAAARPRRALDRDDASLALSGTTIAASSEFVSHLRSSDVFGRNRSGSGSSWTLSVASTDTSNTVEERKFKDDKGKRAIKVIREIVLTERAYVQSLQDLVDIYIKPAAISVNIRIGIGVAKDTTVPASERRIVFGCLDSLFLFHKDVFLPALESAAAPLMDSETAVELQETDADVQLYIKVAKNVGIVFLKHAAFMKMYSAYINNFDNAIQRFKYWSSDKSPGTSGATLSPSSSTAQFASLLGLSIPKVSAPAILPELDPTTSAPSLTVGQRKRIKSYLKQCRINPRHTQLNLEGYLLLPIHRIPRYRLLLEELMRSTPPSDDPVEDPLERAWNEISSLTNNMNRGKLESESRRKLVKWQARINGKFPSPLVQPHRRLIMDGPLLLTRVVRKTKVSFEVINAQGDPSTVQVDCLAPELTPRLLIGILCTDMLVLCRDPSDGKDPNSTVDLWAALRMQTQAQPASIVHGNVLRLVDNKAILYFDAPSPSDALSWYQAINLYIPASKR